MILDDIQRMRSIDRSDMLADLQTLPDQLDEAWQIANLFGLPKIEKIRSITIAGMGGSAIGADILAAFARDLCERPISVVRGYSLPAWVSGPHDLVVCSSHSGNTEETLSAFKEALGRDCACMAISRGGKLKNLAEESGSVFWQFEHAGQPRSAVGFSFGMLLNLLSRIGLVPDQAPAITNATASMRVLIDTLDAHIPVEKNMAKRIAGQACGRQPVIFAAEHLEPIARRWKTQINEIAKGWAGFEFIPEANHNTLAGLENPEKILEKIYAIFLKSGNYNARNQKRVDLTFDQFMVSGLCTDKVELDGKNRLAEIWQNLILGDFISYYLAMLYGVDPTPIDVMDEFKESMKS